MVVFGLAALAREPWQVAVAVLLIGFQLGNTGVMLSGIRDVTPRARIGTTIGLFGAAGPIGFAVGPVLAGLLIDGAGWSIPGVFALSAALSLATALLVGLGTREIRPSVVPEGPILRLARDAVRGVVGDPVVRRLFAVYGVVFLANQMSRPYTPVLVEGVVGIGVGLASAIALVMGVASLVGAVVSPWAGWVGDRAGFRPVLVAALLAGAGASLLMPVMPGLAGLTLVAVVLGGAVASVGAMVFSLLATEVPPERRSATLNLVYLPLYVAGIAGPAMGAAVSAATGAGGPFVLGGLVYLAGAAVVALRRAPASGARPPREAVPLD
jgi:MFS transporter, DHA1 family, multidrug resistance protein